MTQRSGLLLACLGSASKLALALLIACTPGPQEPEVERLMRIAGGSCRECAALGVSCPLGCRGATR